MPDDDIWFEPKRFGYGAGLPVAWQGWALIGGFLALIAALAATLSRHHPIVFAAVVLILTAGLLPITARHTRGGWRWRMGGD